MASSPGDPLHHRTRGVRPLAGVALLAAAAAAQGLHVDVRDPHPRPNWIALPYVFRTESLQTAYGVAGGTSGSLQESSRTFAALLASSNDSAAGYLAVTQLRLSRRSFLDLFASAGAYTDLRLHTDPPGMPGTPPAGSNDSSPDQVLEGHGIDNWFDVRWRYVLPIGDGVAQPLAVWQLDRGLLASEPTGGHGWDPWQSGRTALELRPVVRRQRVEVDGQESAYDELMLAARLEWENTDYPQNPERGGSLYLTVKQGLEGFGDSQDWTALEAEVAAYLPLGTNDHVRQSVLAFDLWTADTPSWRADGDGRPPFYEAARLGGFHRLRGFPTHRFHDRAAIHGTAELRVIPDFNPLDGGILRPLEIDWIQLVAFAEVGRVAPRWSLSNWTDDLRWDAGLGLRLMARRTVVRVDAAWSDETWGLWVMVGHSFGLR